MENIISRYRNISILAVIVIAQVLGLAVQVKRSTENESSRLIRVWAVKAVTPLGKSIVWIQNGTANLWHNYIYLRGVRQENRDLKQEIQRLRIQQVRLSEDAEQARRLQALLAFKEQFISKTVPSQVIGSSGSEQSRSVFIDKGSSDGIKPDMAVITADGVVGKVLRVYDKHTSEVLRIDDQTSGVGAILEQSRLQGILRGTAAGELVLEKVMADEQVQVGEKVVTSGGDQIFLKGLPVGTVSKVAKGSESFLNIWIKPVANLSKLEEVLVVTGKEEKIPDAAETGPVRAVDILSQRLPSVPDKPAADAAKDATAAAADAVKTGATAAKPNGTKPNEAKPEPPQISRSQTKAPGITPKPNLGQGKTVAEPKSNPPVLNVSDPGVKAAPVKPQADPASPQTEPPAAGDRPQ